MNPHEAARVLVVPVRGPVSPEQAQRLYTRLEARLEAHEPVCVRCRVQGAADLSVLEVLARIALIAGRRHTSVRVTSTCPDLHGLLWLTGLASVIAVEPEQLSQAAGETEASEEGGVEEVVDVRDLPP